MDPINPLNRMIETLRQQMAESAKRMDRPQTSMRADTADSSARADRASLLELRRRIGHRVRSIKRDSANGPRQARRIFLESVLAWEFGDQLLLDAELHRVIDGVNEAIESDSEINDQLNGLLADLAKT